MNEVRIGLIGLGVIGNTHANNMKTIKGATFSAVCDMNKDAADACAKTFGCAPYYSVEELLDAHVVDAVLIATPHYFHTSIGIQALKKGYHVLVEKPISVHKADCQRLIAAHKDKKLKFAAMFNQRTDPLYRKVRQLVQGGDLGEISRVNWIITNWFRSDYYYASGGWRATWKGEGGGVLLNQCPHNLDIMQWICGMPSKMRAFCGLGKHHDIEVEDDVTAYFTYPNGATGVFITTTGEAPGTNRFEICGEMGKIVVENGKIQFTRNEIGQNKFRKTVKTHFGKPDIWNIDIPINGAAGQHAEILQNFVDSILKGTPLIAPAEEGIYSVELANAMLYSSIFDKTVDLPLNGAAYERLLNKLIDQSTRTKKIGKKK